jgi:hypothetical protein
VSTDPVIRDQAAGVLSGIFSHIGSSGNAPSPFGLGGALGGQVEQFLQMPVELTKVFLDMSVQLTELVLSSLEEAGFVLARGLVP